jgi:hypothetical protein
MILPSLVIPSVLVLEFGSCADGVVAVACGGTISYWDPGAEEGADDVPTAVAVGVAITPPLSVVNI